MSKVFLNGEFIEENEAKVSINDAGYYFGDGVYEVILLYKGKLIDKERHLDRLEACFKKVYFKNCPTKEEILKNIEKLLELNKNTTTASIYMQFTRGTAIRTHSFYNLNLTPSCLIKMIPCEISDQINHVWNCQLINDPRRFRCDIKMISLLPMVLAKYESEQNGYDDVVFFNPRVNSITEGSSFNVFIVSKDNKLITCPLGEQILPGTMRAKVLELAKDNGIEVEERFYSKEELFDAKEVFATGSIKIIVPITKINNINIGNGEVGDITQKMYKDYINFIDNYEQ